ncbi:MAG: hypothetical protein IPK15_16370 [Verrucomicrobia bacterium]|nr:hypothetical protein [Verrucomicrobiota bacterium]
MITLILLAVISTLAIAFLGLTQRETGSVDSMGRTTDSEVAADSALERAKAEITAVYPIRNQDVAANGPNILGPDMTVSICCQNYDTATRRTIPYDRLLNPLQRLTNRYDAAPPVFVQTNSVVDVANPLDDRFSVDLNRNGLFEDSGYVRDLEVGRFGTNEINWRVGDPQWIGVLQNPRRAHAPNNKYIGRYAFMILPVGRSLDLNWIHNDAKSPNPYPVGESGFTRNQGIGGFENNLAGFLADLNGDIWNNPNAPYLATPYSYSLDIATGNRGTAFDDAWQILNARYGGAKAGLDRMSVLFQPTPIVDVEALIGTDLIDPFGNARYTPADVSAFPGPERRQDAISSAPMISSTRSPCRELLLRASRNGCSPPAGTTAHGIVTPIIECWRSWDLTPRSRTRMRARFISITRT